MQGWLRDVERGGAQREMENFEVALDGKIVAREPNGDVIQMEVPGWQVLDRLKRMKLSKHAARSSTVA